MKLLIMLLENAIVFSDTSEELMVNAFLDAPNLIKNGMVMIVFVNLAMVYITKFVLPVLKIP